MWVFFEGDNHLWSQARGKRAAGAVWDDPFTLHQLALGPSVSSSIKWGMNLDWCEASNGTTCEKVL